MDGSKGWELFCKVPRWTQAVNSSVDRLSQHCLNEDVVTKWIYFWYEEMFFCHLSNKQVPKNMLAARQQQTCSDCDKSGSGWSFILNC